VKKSWDLGVACGPILTSQFSTRILSLFYLPLDNTHIRLLQAGYQSCRRAGTISTVFPSDFLGPLTASSVCPPSVGTTNCQGIRWRHETHAAHIGGEPSLLLLQSVYQPCNVLGSVCLSGWLASLTQSSSKHGHSNLGMIAHGSLSALPIVELKALLT
jgi:hypothetical protein